MTGERWKRIGLLALCLAVVGSEGYLLFGTKDGAFRIRGRHPYRIHQVADGTPVSQAFMMLGDGMVGVDVYLVSNAPARARVQWTLSRGIPDVPPLTVVGSGETAVVLRADHPERLSIPTTRDGSSHDRWYTIELRLLEPLAAEGRRPEVAIMATRDNPDRGGVLWVENQRQSGSLLMRARWQSVTVYRRFVTEGVPHLPPLLREPVVQAFVAVVLHWALAVYMLSLFRAARRGAPRSRP